jgi:5-methyltetrahydropteroyltriglutamate--homocysteine methyltransferase
LAFSTTVVGSFPRPAELIEATEQYNKGGIRKAQLESLLSDATKSTIEQEEGAGLDVITDGEQRRSSFVSFVGDKIPGFTVMHITELDPDAKEILKRNKVQLTYARALVTEHIGESVIAADEFEAARKYSKKPFKVTLPAPYLLMWECWHKGKSREAYRTPEEFAYAYAKVLRKEVERLRDAGVAFIQLDEPMLGDLTEAGEKPDRYRTVFHELNGQEYRGFKEELKLAVDLVNSVTTGISGVRIGVHMDRWPNKDSPYFDQGYERFLPELLEMRTNQLVLEYTCYDEKTRALTKDGLKDFRGLNVGDEVLSLNPDTRLIEWKPVSAVRLYSYEGKMIHFAGKSFDLLVTPNHRMYIEAPGTRGSFEHVKRFRIESASRTASRAVFWFPTGDWEGSPVELTPEEFYLVGLYIGDGNVSVEQTEMTKTGLSLEEYVEMARDAKGRFIEIVGRGPTLKTYHWPKTMLYIPPEDKSTRQVERCLNQLGIEWSRQSNGMIGFHPRKYERIFIECGKGAENKRIPRSLLEAPPTHLRCLLQGLIHSDGFGGRQYQTVSSKLATDIAELVTKLGLSATTRTMEAVDTTIEGHRAKGRVAYRISIKAKPRGATRRNIKEAEYAGMVWCVEVEDNHNLLVERNGRFAFSGNSPGSGDPAKLVKEFPSGLEIGLGVVSVQDYAVETPDQIVKRVDRITRFIDPEKIWLNPDCGFAPGMFRTFPRDTAFAKRRAMTTAANMLRDRA